jgi:deazaflavin-dependent oxidoreductase (nitroreductase family)
MKLSQIEARIESLPPVRAAGIRLLKVHQWVYERSGGRVGHRLGPTRNLLLRTVGARSGLPRTTALTYSRDGGDYIVVASMGGAPRSPGWYHNLRARPEAEIQIGTRRLPVTARAVLPGDPDRDRLWRLADRNNGGRYSQYQKATTRPIPVVALTPR